MTQALSELTIVDPTGTVATAYCGRLYAAFGARVVNLETLPTGHATRALGPFFDGRQGPEASALHAWLSAGKESVPFDPEDARDLEAVAELCRSADAVLDGYGSTETPDRGLFREPPGGGPGPLHVVCSWFGATGPFARAPGADVLVTSRSGSIKGFGPADGPPLLPAGYQSQIIGGITAFIASLASLLGARRGRRLAQGLDVSLLEANLCLTEAGAPGLFNSGIVPDRLGINVFWPTYPGGIYRSSDGWIGVTALTPSQWTTFCTMLGLDDIAAQERYLVTLERLADIERLDKRIAPALLEKTSEEWFHEGQEKRVPLALVPTVDDLLACEQFTERGAFVDIDGDSDGGAGAGFQAPGIPFRLHATPARASGRSPRLGADRTGADRTATEAPRRTGGEAHPPVGGGAMDELLGGLRVVDLSMGWAGPLAARHLADLGADVVKVESCSHYDWWRGWDLTPEGLALLAYEKAPAFNMVNRNKRAITLDLATETGADLLKKLVAASDVVVENYAGSVLPDLGLDYEVLREVNPSLVMISMPPFGASGPWRRYRAYGSTVEQASGLPHFQGEAGGPPAMQHVALGDPIAGINGAAALLTALWHRERTGEGQLIDLSHVESLLALGIHGFLEKSVNGRDVERLGRRHPEHAPHGVYACRGENQWLTIAVETDGQWAELARFMGLGLQPVTWAAEERFATAAGRKRHEDELDARLDEWTSPRTRALIATKLWTLGVPCAPLNDSGELLADPQLASRGFWQWLRREHVGLQPHPSPPYRSGNDPLPIRRPAPTLGEHNHEILTGLLGLEPERILELEATGIIGTVPVAR